MLDFRIITQKDGSQILETRYSGKALLSIPQLNKGTAFTHEERVLFKLEGKLPTRIETLEDQVKRAYLQFNSYHEKINQNLYLRQLLNTNQVLFYKLVSEHLHEMIPVLYTPIVGNLVQEYNERYLQPRGLYIAYGDQDRIQEILNNRSNPEIQLIVVSDGQGVLGIGDQGAGAMAIPVAKLIVYTAFSGIDPLKTLPIMLDAGTDNQTLLDDPYYLGWRHRRMTGKPYETFIDKFVCAVKQTFPHVFLHWEDFGRHYAYHNLKKYRDKICSFNDDLQGTGIVTLAAILSAIHQTGQPMDQQRIVIFGGGTAGMGVTNNICNALIRHGMPEATARKNFWIIDRNGLITEKTEEVTEAQQPYSRPIQEVTSWNCKDPENISLLETIQHIKPSILIGCSAQTDAFTEDIINAMSMHVKHPIILPLSNPTEKCEATPKNIMEWSRGQAIIATGSPFDPVDYQGHSHEISQCNNYLAFPGLGLGVIAAKVTSVNDNILWAASEALSQFSQQHNRLLPRIEQAREASVAVALAVANSARTDGLSDVKPLEVKRCIAQHQWDPQYLHYKPLT
jgi:malate dehydrogenase (oxaloacetate-decarboxylating)